RSAAPQRALRSRTGPAAARRGLPRRCGSRSMHALQRRRLALFDRGSAVGTVIAEEFVRQGLLALLAGIRPGAAIEPACGDAQACRRPEPNRATGTIERRPIP